MKLSAPRKPTLRLAASILSAVSAALTIGLIALLPGCGWWSSGSRNDTNVGKELASLRQAYDKGAITKEEYERERKRIVGDW